MEHLHSGLKSRESVMVGNMSRLERCRNRKAFMTGKTSQRQQEERQDRCYGREDVKEEKLSRQEKCQGSFGKIIWRRTNRCPDRSTDKFHPIHHIRSWFYPAFRLRTFFRQLKYSDKSDLPRSWPVFPALAIYLSYFFDEVPFNSCRTNIDKKSLFLCFKRIKHDISSFIQPCLKHLQPLLSRFQGHKDVKNIRKTCELVRGGKRAVSGRQKRPISFDNISHKFIINIFGLSRKHAMISWRSFWYRPISDSRFSHVNSLTSTRNWRFRLSSSSIFVVHWIPFFSCRSFRL